jgi:hypothetical protein
MRKIRKVYLFLGLVIFLILAVSCIETNYPTESTGKFFVHNEATSGKTITRIAVTSVPSGAWATSTYYNERASIQPGSKSQRIALSISYSDYISSWNIFRVTVTTDNNSTAYVNIILYEDIELNLHYDGANLVKK